MAEHTLNEMVAEAFGLPPYETYADIIKHVDRRLLATEARDLLRSSGKGFAWDRGYGEEEPAIPYGGLTIEPCSPKTAEHMFLHLAGELGL